MSHDFPDGGQHLTTELPMVSQGRVSGRVRWFSAEKGYGFIAPVEGGEDVFVRYSAIEADGFRALETGTEVNFLVSSDARGPRAVAVRPGHLAEGAD